MGLTNCILCLIVKLFFFFFFGKGPKRGLQRQCLWNPSLVLETSLLVGITSQCLIPQKY